jgi:hypothetical protein
MTISPADSTFLQQQEDVHSSSYVDSNYCITTNSDMDMNNYNSLSSSINFKNIIQMHFFEKIMRDSTKYSDIWRLIDDRKLKDGLHELFEAYHRTRFDTQKQMMTVLNESSGASDIVAEKEKFPMINQFGIPFSSSVLQSLVRDIVSIQDKTNVDLLTFNSFNGKRCCLVQPIQSSSYNLFKQNVRRTKWLDKLLSAICAGQEEAAGWIFHLLGKKYEEKFAEVAVHIGLLLPSKVMDAETACAMWEEANCTYKSQRVILRHLRNFFGCCITVPERYIGELEEGVLDPICGEAEFDGKQVSFWHKNIDDVLLHQLKLELKHHGSCFFSNFTTVDVVFGADHGA